MHKPKDSLKNKVLNFATQQDSRSQAFKESKTKDKYQSQALSNKQSIEQGKNKDGIVVLLSQNNPKNKHRKAEPKSKSISPSQETLEWAI